MATILPTLFPNAFIFLNEDEFQLRFHWSLFPQVQLTISDANRSEYTERVQYLA